MRVCNNGEYQCHTIYIIVRGSTEAGSGTLEVVWVDLWRRGGVEERRAVWLRGLCGQLDPVRLPRITCRHATNIDECQLLHMRPLRFVSPPPYPEPDPGPLLPCSGARSLPCHQLQILFMTPSTYRGGDRKKKCQSLSGHAFLFTHSHYSTHEIHGWGAWHSRVSWV